MSPETARPVPGPPGPTVARVVGVDLGQATDPTAVCVADVALRATGYEVAYEPTVEEQWAGTDPDAPPARPRFVPERETVYALVHLERLPLNTSYPAVVANLADLLDGVRRAEERDARRAWATDPRRRYGVHLAPPRIGRGPILLAVDGTGVGRPVVDMIADAGLGAEMVPIVITAGDAAIRDPNGYYRVPKKDLIGLARLLLDAVRLRWAAGLPEAPVLERELKDYRVKTTAALHETYNAREGAHDDLLLAAACACWAGEVDANRVAVG